MKLVKLFLFSLFLGLTACGGGGGGGGNAGAVDSSNPGQQSSVVQSSSSTSSDSSSSVSVAPILLQPITRQNTPYLASTVFSLFDFVSAIPHELTGLVMDLKSIVDGTYINNCDDGGKVTLTVGANKSVVELAYENCAVDGVRVSGKTSIKFLNDGVGKPYHVVYKWSDFKASEISSPAHYSQITGETVYIGKINNSYDNDSYFSVSFNGQFYDSIQGALVVENANFSLWYSTYDHVILSMLDKDQSYSGRIYWSEKGAADFKVDDGLLMLTGSTAAVSKIEVIDGLRIYWDEQNDGYADARLMYNDVYINDLSNPLFNGSNEIKPSGKYSEIFVAGPKYMSRGDTYVVDIRDALTHTSVSLLDFGLVVDGDHDSNGNWTQPEAGKFILTFPDNQEDKTYHLVFFARDSSGKTYEIPVDFYVGADFDKDHVPDKYDDDDDNDSVVDTADLYPFNELESKDTDNDGLPDNQDPDADADGVPNFADANPTDASNCLEGKNCYSHNLVAPMLLDKNNILYYETYTSALNVIAMRTYVNRFDTSTGTFLTPIMLPDASYNKMLYEPVTHSLYVSGSRSISVTDLTSMESSLLIQSEQLFGVRYVENNHIVIGRYMNPASLYIESYDAHGKLISSMPGDDRLTPVIPYKYARYCDSAITSDSQGGLFVHKNFSAPLCGSIYSSTYPKISNDNSRIYRSEGEVNGIYLTSDNSLLIAIPSGLQFYWVSNSYILFDFYGDRIVKLYDESGVLIQTFTIPEGEFFRGVYTNENRIILNTSLSERPNVKTRVFDARLSLLQTYGY